MLDRVGKFVKSYEEMGKQITRLQKTYEEGEKKLAPGGQSIVTTSMKLIKLGAKQNPKNPVADAEEADIAEQTHIGNTNGETNAYSEEK